MSRKRESPAAMASPSATPAKKRQMSINFFCKQESTPKFSTVIKPQRASTGLKVYTEEEIHHSSGYTRYYREFWNRKVAEMNSDAISKKAANDDKVAARGAIDTAWATEKAELLTLDAHRFETVINDRSFQASRKTLQALKSVMGNVERVGKTRSKIERQYAEIQNMMQQPDTAENRELIRSMEDKIDSYISELKKANDALKKGIENCSTKIKLDKSQHRCDQESTKEIRAVTLSTEEEQAIVDDINNKESTMEGDSVSLLSPLVLSDSEDDQNTEFPQDQDIESDTDSGDGQMSPEIPFMK